MDSNVVIKALLESDIEIREAALKKTTDKDERARIERNIEGSKKYLKNCFPESKPVEISKADLDKIFEKLEKRVYPEGRIPPGQA